MDLHKLHMKYKEVNIAAETIANSIRLEETTLEAVRYNKQLVEENINFLRSEEGIVVSLKEFKFIKYQYDHYVRAEEIGDRKVKGLKQQLTKLEKQLKGLKEKMEITFYHEKDDNKVLYLKDFKAKKDREEHGN